MPEILTPKQVAEYLQISRSKIYYMIRAGQIPYIRFGRNVRIRKIDLEKWIEARMVMYYSDVWYIPQ